MRARLLCVRLVCSCAAHCFGGNCSRVAIYHRHLRRARLSERRCVVSAAVAHPSHRRRERACCLPARARCIRTRAACH
jgi:hypothetical protein